MNALIQNMISFPTEMDRWGKITFDQSPSHTPVLGDPFRIQQILKKFISFCSNCPAVDLESESILVSVQASLCIKQLCVCV